MIVNLKTFLGQGKFLVNKTINFVNNSQQDTISTFGTATISNLKLNIKNDASYYDGKKVGGFETFSFNPSDFNIFEVTIEGLKSSNSATDTGIFLKSTYGVNTGDYDYIVISNGELSIKQNNISVFKKTLNYNIGTYADRVRNLTLRINKNDSTIQLLEDGQILINETVQSDYLVFNKSMHFTYIISNATETTYSSDIYQVKVNLFG